jgi:O-antigen ligase
MMIFALIATLIALSWGSVILVRGGLVAGCLLVLLAGSCFGSLFYNLPGGPMPITSDRLLWVVLLAQYFVWRKFGLADPKPLTRTDLLLAAFLAVLAFSTVTHDWRLMNAMPASRLVFYYLMPVGIYWVARQTRITERSMTAVFASCGLFGVYLAVTGIAERRELWWAVFPGYIKNAEYTEFFGRARGPFLNPIGTGIFLCSCLCAGLMLWPRMGRIGRLALLASVGLTALGVQSTMTRSVWMGLALSVGTVVALSLPRSWRLPILGGATLAACLVVATQWESLLSFKRDKDLSAEATAESVELRPILATIAWNIFCDRPLLGVGFGQYKEENINYMSDRSSDLPLTKARPYVQHNVFLSLLAETGLLGMGTFVALLGVWGWHAWQLWRLTDAPDWARRQGLLFLAVLGCYLPNGMFHEVSLIPMVNMLLFFMAGLTEGLSLAYGPDRQLKFIQFAGSQHDRHMHPA